MKILLSSGLLMICCGVNAAPYDCVGNVEFVRIMDPQLWGSDRSYIRLTACPSAGSCLVEAGSVVLALRDDSNAGKQISVALAAQASGKKVHININDSFKNSVGSCYISFITSLNY